MQWAALVAWILTASGGAGLGYVWSRGGGLKQVGGIRPPRLFLHAGLAVIGLATWIVFVADGDSAFAWIAVALLAAVAGIGATMALIWLRGRPAPAAPTELPAEASFPLPVVIAHGALGAFTLFVSLLAALGVGT
jgi:hypothetical protein